MWAQKAPTAACPMQVSFHNEKALIKVKVERKINDILNRLEKTRTEVDKPDLEGEKEVCVQGSDWYE